MTPSPEHLTIEDELLSILERFDAYWQENGDRLDFGEGLRLVKPGLIDLLRWLRESTQSQPDKENE